MTVEQMRKKSNEDLRMREGELRKELFNLRFQAVLGSLANPSRPRQVRREIARVKTILRQKAEG